MNAIAAAIAALLLFGTADEKFDFNGEVDVSGVRWEKIIALDGGPSPVISFRPDAVARLAVLMKEHPGAAIELSIDGIRFARQLAAFKASDNWVITEVRPELRTRLKQIELRLGGQ